MKKVAVVMVVLGLMLGCGKKPSNQNPVADFTWVPANPAVGANVTFTDASSDADGTVQSWSWTFTDGTPATSTAQSPTGVQFSSGGWKAVQLTVTDDKGAVGTVTKNVPVQVAGDTTDPELDVTSIKLKGTASDASDVDSITATLGGAVSTTPGLPAASVTWETGDITLGSGPGDSNVSVTITAEDGAATPNQTQVVVDVVEDLQ